MRHTQSKLLLVAGFAALSLTACSQPHMFPTGYTHHAKEFKSANPPESDKFTTEQRQTMTGEQAEQFRMAVYQLVERLTTRAGQSPKPVYVLRPEKMSAFYANIDNNLRESLRHMGYRLSDTPDGAYVFTYTAALLREGVPVGPDGQPVDLATLSSDNVRIALQVHDKLGEDSKMLTEESGTFHINGAELLTVPFTSFLGVSMPDPNGSLGSTGNN